MNMLLNLHVISIGSKYLLNTLLDKAQTKLHLFENIHLVREKVLTYNLLFLNRIFDNLVLLFRHFQDFCNFHKQ